MRAWEPQARTGDRVQAPDFTQIEISEEGTTRSGPRPEDPKTKPWERLVKEDTHLAQRAAPPGDVCDPPKDKGRSRGRKGKEGKLRARKEGEGSL